MEQEKRLRREIANSNERRRMQSINAGFAGLRNLLPNHEGEKLSKAAILQQTSDYIYQLLQEKNKLLSYNNQLKRMLAQAGGDASAAGNYSSPQSPANASHHEPPAIAKRRKTVDGALESADEGIGSMSPEHTNDEVRAEMLELRRETMELRISLERERRHRISLEEHVAVLQQQQPYVRKHDRDRIPHDETEVFQSTQKYILPDDPHPKPRCYTVRNNLETIVEAIRHLEGDHLFSDDRNHSSPSSSPPSASPQGIEISTTGSPTSSTAHTRVVEVPLALTATLSSQSCQALPMGTTYIVTSSPGVGSAATTATLQAPMITQVARAMKVEDQPINLEFRPSSRSPSPFTTANQASSSSTLPQQLRPGVIVVKHS